MKKDKSTLCVKINGNICLPEENSKKFDEEFAKFLDTLNAKFDGKKQLTPAEPETDIPNIAISSLEISTRIKNSLHFHNIYTLKELSTYYEEEIRTFRNMGEHSYAELAAVVENYGVHIVSCIENTKELEETFSKTERVELYRKGIATIEDAYQISDEDIVKCFGLPSFTAQKLFKLKKYYTEGQIGTGTKG